MLGFKPLPVEVVEAVDPQVRALKSGEAMLLFSI